jgi:hypothetical protein
VGEWGTGERMGSKPKSLVAAMTLIVALGLGTACSSDGSSSSTNTSAAGSTQGSGTVNKEYETWCTSVQNLIEQSSPGDLSDIGDLASFSQAIQSLASTAPVPIQAQMQTLATATQAKLAAVQQDPSATLPPTLADQADSASQDVAAFVQTNCGLQLPKIDL